LKFNAFHPIFTPRSDAKLHRGNTVSRPIADSVEFGKRIAMARTDAGIKSQMEFARQIGVTRSAVNEWERGKSKPSTGNLGRIAQLTGKSFDWLATGRTTQNSAFNLARADPLAKVALDRITPDTPLRLNVAAALAYPDGSMTAHGLRNEASKGRLVIELTSGKYYTTLGAITRMRELCRQEPKVRNSGSANRAATNTEIYPFRGLSHPRRQTSTERE
jgi:transcriptional regulator with XRE-family HTH domain